MGYSRALSRIHSLGGRGEVSIAIEFYLFHKNSRLDLNSILAKEVWILGQSFLYLVRHREIIAASCEYRGLPLRFCISSPAEGLHQPLDVHDRLLEKVRIS